VGSHSRERVLATEEGIEDIVRVRHTKRMVVLMLVVRVRVLV
jgi:hypothetical protein